MKVVHCKGNSQNTESYHYIGRPAFNLRFHFGNPFSHENVSKALVKVSNRDEACDSFKDWLDGKRYTEVAPERRQWILDNLSLLKGKDLGCWCSPQRCHGDYLLELANRKTVEVNMINIYSMDKNGYEKLSNLLNGPFMKDGIEFKTVEHFYQSLKANFAGNNDVMKFIIDSKTGWDAQRLGRMVTGLDKEKWDKGSSKVLEMGMRECFSQNKSARELLLSTGTTILTHTTPNRNLGKWEKVFPEILMRIRDELRNVGLATFIPMSGNILTSEAESLINTVNCVGIMGKGLAADFKEAYPAMFLEYKKVCDAGKLEPGKLHIWRNVINFPTKIHWKPDSKLEWIESGLDKLVIFIKTKDIKSIAIPPLGCGNGNLDKPTVKKLVEDKLRHLNISIEMWNFE